MICVLTMAAMAVAIHILPLLLFVQGMIGEGHPSVVINRDFSNYWMAGQLVMAGDQQHLFSQPVYFARAVATFGPEYGLHNWGYPPHFLLVLWPLGLLSYKPAMVLFLSSTLLLFIAAVWLFRHRFAPQSDRLILSAALTGYVLMQVDTTQNGFLTAAALLAGLAWMQDRPVLAGFAFGFLTIKPQLGLLIPIMLLLDRNWRAFAWSAAFMVALVVLSGLLFGWSSWHAYLTETLAYQRSVMTDWYGIFLRMMPTVFGSARTLGMTPADAAAMQWLWSLCTGALVLWMMWKVSDPLHRIFVLLCGTFVVVPYAFNYDMGALTVVAALLVGSRSCLSRHALLALALVAVLAGVVTHLGRAMIPISPLVLAAALLAIAVPLVRPAAPSRTVDAAPGAVPGE